MLGSGPGRSTCPWDAHTARAASTCGNRASAAGRPLPYSLKDFSWGASGLRPTERSGQPQPRRRLDVSDWHLEITFLYITADGVPAVHFLDLRSRHLINSKLSSCREGFRISILPVVFG